jgi:hypothetical protein
MHRREFIALLGGVAATSSPLAIQAQERVQPEAAAMATNSPWRVA